MPDEASRRQMLVSEIAEAVRCEIAGLTVPEEMHREHHEYIKEWIEERRRRREFRDKIRAQVGGWAVITVLGGIGTAAYNALRYLQEHLR